MSVYESFCDSGEYKTARLLFQHRMAAPESFDESPEHKLAVQAWNRSRHPITTFRQGFTLKTVGCFLGGVLCGLSLLSCVQAEYPNTSLKQGEPHPDCSLVKPEGTDLRKALLKEKLAYEQ